MEIPIGYVSGGDGDRLGGALPHTAEKIGAYVRSSDRERYEREFAGKLRVEKTSQQLRAEQWMAEYKAEQAQKENARLERIRKGELVVHPDGSYTEKLPPRW